MKHFSLIEWADYVRGVLTPEQKSPMQEHLDGHCRQCEDTVRIWASVADFAKRENMHTPPPNAMRIAKSYFVPLKLAARKNWVLQMAKCTFNSLESYAQAGVRGSGAGPCQFMYECDSLVIDLRLEMRPDMRSLGLAGQVVDSKRPERELNGIPVFLLSQEDTWVETTTNQLGEFHFSVSSAKYLRMVVGVEGTAVILPIPNVQAGLA